jgi:hypothetical protein
MRLAVVVAEGASHQARIILGELKTQGADLTLLREAMKASSSCYDLAAVLRFVAPTGLFLITVAYTLYRQVVVRREAS